MQKEKNPTVHCTFPYLNYLRNNSVLWFKSIYLIYLYFARQERIHTSHYFKSTHWAFEFNLYEFHLHYSWKWSMLLRRCLSSWETSIKRHTYSAELCPYVTLCLFWNIDCTNTLVYTGWQRNYLPQEHFRIDFDHKHRRILFLT